MNKFVFAAVLAALSASAVAQEAGLQCPAPSFAAGHEIPLIRQTFSGASKLGDASGATEGPVQWTEKITKVNGGEVEMLRSSSSSANQFLTKLTGWPNEINIVSTNDITWGGGTKDFLFPLTQDKEWEHTYWRQQNGGSQRIKVKIKVTKVERVGDDVLCTVERRMDWDRSFGHYGVSVSVWSARNGWMVDSQSYRTDTKVYVRTSFGPSAK